MGKSVDNSVLDGALNILKNNVTSLVACSAEPTTYTEGSSTYALADATVSSTDFTVADDTSGRKVTIAQQTGATVDSSGTATHVALLDVSNSKLLYVTTCTSQALTSGNTLTFNSFKINIQDPT